MKRESQVMAEAGSISQSPRRLRAKYTHRTNFVYALRISPLQGAIIAGNGSKFVNGCQCIHSQIIWQNLLCRRQGGSAYRKKFIYSNDKTKQCKRQNHLYIQSCKTGKSLPQSQVVNSQKASGIKEIHLLYRLPSCFVLILFTVLPLIWDKKKQETFSDFPLSKTVKFF